MEDIVAFLGSKVFNSSNSYKKCAKLKPTIENNHFYKLQTAFPPPVYICKSRDTAPLVYICKWKGIQPPQLYISERNLEKSNRLQSAVSVLKFQGLEMPGSGEWGKLDLNQINLNYKKISNLRTKMVFVITIFLKEFKVYIVLCYIF